MTEQTTPPAPPSGAPSAAAPEAPPATAPQAEASQAVATQAVATQAVTPEALQAEAPQAGAPAPVPPVAEIPPMPAEPPTAPPAAPATAVDGQEPPGEEPPGQAPPARPRRPRRVLRAVARWTAAVLVFGAASTGTAYGIASMERTDVPGLSTVDDGRWDYPELSLPALPPHTSHPFDFSNDAEIHYVDVRDLLLPAPAGAVADKKLSGGWVPASQFLTEFAEDGRSHLGQVLTDSALRHVAARGWTMPDGTSSRIYLLQFDSVAFATGLSDELTSEGDQQALPVGVTGLELDDSWPEDSFPRTIRVDAYAEKKPYEKEHVRIAYAQAGDTLAVIVHSRKGGGEAAEVPFQQTVVLQDQLLG
ncbi:hypothetical protein [Streptomyces sp. NPDC008125]|uniref:hypothetical protein n=1 Tax=Streptomyces sp. NPDC008125 TaxID=3364811 RepID=UPI0036E6B3CC